MIDRGIIKWQPFNSCISSKDIIEETRREKNKETFPILSEDQLQMMEEKISDAYHLKLTINIEYFWDGQILKATGKISAVFRQEKKICLNNKIIYFKQILKINY